MVGRQLHLAACKQRQQVNNVNGRWPRVPNAAHINKDTVTSDDHRAVCGDGHVVESVVLSANIALHLV